MREFKQWVDLSHKLPGVKDIQWLMVDFQGLGRLDSELFEVRSSGTQLIKNPKGSEDYKFNINEALKQERYMQHSRLWVLSAYEIVRILKELEPKSFGPVYQMFRRLRIPMAKYEKMGNSKIKSVAWPATSTSDGELGWALEDGHFITRERLANELINAVEKYAADEDRGTN